MNSWTGEVNGDDDEPDNGFVVKLQEHVEDGIVSEIKELEFVKNLDEVDDVDLLKQTWLQLEGSGHDEKTALVENRLSDLDAEVGQESEEDEEEVVESKASMPAPESVQEMADADGGEGTEAEESASESQDEQAGEGPPKPASAISVDEAADVERRWKILVWGPPKLFKTHFCYTMPEPIAFIDLEGKADDIAKKFQDKNIQVWQPKRMEATPDTKFRRAKKALDEALDWLDWYYENEGVTGTVVVDSMSLLWEWAQFHHKLENYPTKDPEDVELSANFGSSSESDWATIKEYHNGEFRERITDSRYHFAWTAMERLDFEKTIEEDDNLRMMEPTGEPKNDYKADTVIQARKDSDRGKVGDLVGSNVTDNVFVGLKKPTFAKVRDAIEAIADAEASSESISREELAKQIGAEAVINYDPQVYTQK